jgi:hypothetical protein
MHPADLHSNGRADASEYYQRIGSQTPPTKGRVSGLLRRVFNYASEILTAARLRAATPAADTLVQAVGAPDFRRVLCVIRTALRRAAILGPRLSYEAGIGVAPAVSWLRDLRPKRPRAPAPGIAPGAAPGVTRGTPQAGGPDGPADAPPAAATRTMSREALAAGRKALPAGHQAAARRQAEARRQEDGPSAGRIVADIRRRGVGPVIADICRDLGITSQHPLWPELDAAIRAFGGSTEALEQDEAAGTRWCSLTWMALPYPKPPPTYDFQAWYMETGGKVWEWMTAYEARMAADATGPPTA